MNLEDIYTHLAHGELSNLFVGESGTILSDQRVKIASSVSLGLIDLYKRLLISEKSEQVTLTQGTQAYALTAEDVINIERINDSTGLQVVLNDLSDDHSFMVIGDSAFNISDNYLEDNQYTSEEVTVYYRASHPELDLTAVASDPATVNIELPRNYLSALLYYVASRVHTPIGLTNEFHKGNDYLSKYEAEVARLSMSGIPLDRVADHDRFHQNGWV